MTETTANGGAFAALDAAESLRTTRRGREKKADRLPPMLFLAALIHGILIIGITFNPIVGGESEAISLEVTIVAEPERAIERPEDAAYLAQASQEGAGNTLLDVRPGALPETDAPIDNPGEAAGDSLATTQAAADAADQLVTTVSEAERATPNLPREQPEDREQTARALEAGVDLTLPLPRDDVPRLEIHSDDPRQLVTSVDTRESVIAGYLDAWKRKIEAIGVEYFPEQALASGATGSPTLEVTIDASGELHEVLLRRSSGSRLLDQAALDILRRAAPFDPFPQAVRADYDQLRFAYKWQFSEIEVPATAASAN
ncbi:MAG TPA: energy transducer TonB [Woeseiaceae bacterium]|jgi:protein TonB|nr:energy transducer TonB [Woeseiaceae bacterium]